jgi:hypothetical protein
VTTNPRDSAPTGGVDRSCESVLRTEFRIPADGWLGSLAAVEGVQSVELDSTVPMGEDRVKVFASLTCESVDPASTLAGLSITVEDCRAVDASGRHRAVFVADFRGSVLSTVVTEGAIPCRVVARDGEVRAVVTVEDWEHLRRLAAVLEGEHGEFVLQGTTELGGPGYPLGRDDLAATVRGTLTDDQIEVLRTAYEMGHFAVPQQSTSEAVAEELGVARSTVSERLRRSQESLLAVLFGDRD